MDKKPSRTGVPVASLRAIILALPSSWLLLFLFIPLVGICAVSFLSRGDYGELQLPLTLENYKRIAGFGLLGFDSLYPQIILRSLLMGVGTAVCCVLAGLPLAFFIARLPGRLKTVALLLVIIPFWTNLLIRTYAWQIILAPDGWLVGLFRLVGLPGLSEALYPGPIAVLIGMVCDFVPFLVLPLYASVEKIDWTIAEAAADLGANRVQVFRHAILPQIMPGLVAGIILVLLPAAGQFVVPDLLGGAKTAMLGNAIQQQFGQSRDWPFGAAIAFVALAIVCLSLFFYSRYSQRRGAEMEVL